MTQPVDSEQSRVDEQLADAPSPRGEALLDVLFDPRGHDPITNKEMVAYVAFLKGLPQSCTEIPLAKDRMMMCFETYRGIGISVWEASAIYAAISGTEAVVPLDRALTLVRYAFRTICGYIEDDGTDEPSQAQDLFKACKAIASAFEAAEARNAPPRAWVERQKSRLSPTLATAMAGAASLRHYPARQAMLRPYPEYEELPLAAYNNAPRRPADDGAKKHLEQHARDVLRQLATLDLVLRGSTAVDRGLDPATIVEATFANVAAMVNSIAESRKQAVDARFDVPKTEPALFAKEDLAALQARSSVAKALQPSRQWDKGQPRGRDRPYQKPYQKPKGKGKGKGRGKGPKRFPASRTTEEEEH